MIVKKVYNWFETLLEELHQNREMIKLKSFKRYVHTTTVLYKKKIKIIDSCTYLSGKKSILENQIYDFNSAKPDPLIIDCGANIGLSVIFFKKRYPSSKVIIFEADPQIFKVLKHNIDVFKFQNVKLYNEAVWINNDKISFNQEGGFSGRLSKGKGDCTKKIIIQARRLRDILKNNIVDFLKMDIEGAESSVINDCSDLIHCDRVHHFFFEYHSHVDEQQSLHDILSLLYRRGYRYHIKETFTRKKPFIDNNTLLGMDLQLDVFAWNPLLK